MTYIPPTKNIEPSIFKVLSLNKTADYIVSIPNHHLDKFIFKIEKGKKDYKFCSSSKILRGLQNHKELNFESNQIVELESSFQKIFVTGKYIFLTNISYDEVKGEKIFCGKITSYSTCKELVDFDNNYLRCVIPVGKYDVFKSHDFEGSYFKTPKNSTINFTNLNVGEESFHLYNYKYQSEYYFVVDCQQKTSLIEFQKKCFNILLALGFINGNLIQDEAFFISFSNLNMENPIDVLYHSVRSSVKTNQPTFTTNAYSVHSDIDFKHDEKGLIIDPMIEKLDKEMIFFPSSVFSALATLMHKNEKLQRAVLIFIQSHNLALEIRIPNYYVAIEAISSYIMSELVTDKKPPTPIVDKKVAQKLIDNVLTIAESLKDENKLSDEDFNMNILSKNINRLNSPPNADKLAIAFSHINYHLSQEQKNLLKDRNIFLHGSFLKTVGHDEEFRKALHVSLRLHFMIAVLIYKISGFSGRIINYAELWSHMTENKLGEERLVNI